jgi:hypothetical protein
MPMNIIIFLFLTTIFHYSLFCALFLLMFVFQTYCHVYGGTRDENNGL